MGSPMIEPITAATTARAWRVVIDVGIVDHGVAPPTDPAGGGRFGLGVDARDPIEPAGLATSHGGQRPPHRRGVDGVFHHVVADHEITGRALGIAEHEDFTVRQLHARRARGHA